MKPDAGGASSLLSSLQDPRVALDVFRSIPPNQADVVSFNSLFKALGNASVLSETPSSLWTDLLAKNITPQESTFLLFAKICAKQRNIDALHDALMTYVERVPPSHKILRAWMSACCAIENVSRAPALLGDMQRRFGLRPDMATIGMLCSACSRLGDHQAALQVLESSQSNDLAWKAWASFCFVCCLFFPLLCAQACSWMARQAVS